MKNMILFIKDRLLFIFIGIGLVFIMASQSIFNSDLKINGDMSYNFTHAVGSADSMAFVTGSVRFTYYKINTGGFSWHETVNLLGQGDSVQIQKAGYYKVWVWIAESTSATSDQLRVKLYVNNSPLTIFVGRYLINSQGTGNEMTTGFMWYKTTAYNVGDWLSIRTTNLSANRAITITDIKIFIEKVPEN